MKDYTTNIKKIIRSEFNIILDIHIYEVQISNI